MRRVIACLTLFFCTILSNGCDWTKSSMEHPVIDRSECFKEVKIEFDPKQPIFMENSPTDSMVVVNNFSEKALEIKEIRFSCGCTTLKEGSEMKKTLAPNSSLEIPIKISGAGKAGKSKVSATILISDGQLDGMVSGVCEINVVPRISMNIDQFAVDPSPTVEQIETMKSVLIYCFDENIALGQVEIRYPRSEQEQLLELDEVPVDSVRSLDFAKQPAWVAKLDMSRRTVPSPNTAETFELVFDRSVLGKFILQCRGNQAPLTVTPDAISLINEDTSQELKFVVRSKFGEPKAMMPEGWVISSSQAMLNDVFVFTFQAKGRGEGTLTFADEADNTAVVSISTRDN